MLTRGFWALDDFSDDELERRLQQLVTAGRRTEARIVAHLAEVDARRIHAKSATSLFAYCQERLGLSEMEAFYRITAARMASQYPIIFELLESGAVHLSGICAVRRHLTNENHRELLAEISGKSKRKIELLMAERFPRPDVPERWQRLRAFEPLAPGRYLLQLTVSEEQKEKLERARELTSHSNPTGDLATLVERGTDIVIAREERRQFGRTGGSATAPPKAPRKRAQTRDLVASAASTEQPHSRGRAHIARQVRRQVSARDGICCTFVSPSGTRCQSRAFLQLHHEQAWAKGGSDEAANLRFLCATHNRLLAEREFGATRVAGAIEERRSAAGAAPLKNATPRLFRNK